MTKLETPKRQFYHVKIDSINYWSDPTIVLSWIRTPPNRLNMFVANRMQEIQDSTEPENWHHVSTNETLAELVSRDISPEDIQNCKLWWKGPKWLSLPEENWPKSTLTIVKERPELKKIAMTQTMLSYESKTEKTGSLTTAEIQVSKM